MERREGELRVLIRCREEEVANAMAKREEEIMEAVRKREAEVHHAWSLREAEIRQGVEDSIKAVQERMDWITKREDELTKREDELNFQAKKIEEMREESVEKVRASEASRKGQEISRPPIRTDQTIRTGKVQKTPLEEVKNILEPATCVEIPVQQRRQPANTAISATRVPDLNLSNQATPKPLNPVQYFTALKTPITRLDYTETLPSAMKGVILTATGEALATPSPSELAKIFNQSPRVGLGFTKIFESDAHAVNDENSLRDKRSSNVSAESEEADSPPPSPSTRKERGRKDRGKDKTGLYDASSGSGSSTSTLRLPAASIGTGTGVTQIRSTRPSISSSAQRPTIKRALSTTAISAAASSKPAPSRSTLVSSASTATSKPLQRPKSTSRLEQHSHLRSTVPLNPGYVPLLATIPTQLPPAPIYDFTDEENLPSPFLKKTVGKHERAPSVSASKSASKLSVVSSSLGSQKRLVSSKKRASTSNGNILWVMAATNVANGKRASSTLDVLPGFTAGQQLNGEDGNVNGETTRPMLLNARKATGEAQKIPLR